MSNAPQHFEKFVVPEGEQKIKFVRDTKVANAGTFVIQREDHTVGNLIRVQLHRDDAVTFAGYRIPHPLEHVMQIKVQTTGSKTPIDAVHQAIDVLEKQTVDLRGQFQQELITKGFV